MKINRKKKNPPKQKAMVEMKGFSGSLNAKQGSFKEKIFIKTSDKSTVVTAAHDS